MEEFLPRPEVVMSPLDGDAPLGAAEAAPALAAPGRDEEPEDEQCDEDGDGRERRASSQTACVVVAPSPPGGAAADWSAPGVSTARPPPCTCRSSNASGTVWLGCTVTVRSPAS